MLVRSVLFLGVAFTRGACYGDVERVVNSTAQLIASLQEQGEFAKRRFKNVSKFERQLDEIGHHAEADFDVQRYSEKTNAYTDLAERASKKATEASSSTNATAAEELSAEAEALLRNMTKVGFELDGIEQDFHDELQRALGAKLDPELATADNVSGEASHLQKMSHSMMDPLYSWGDAAEDQADKLNDQTNDALSAVDKIVRPYRRDIARHSGEVQRAVERKLFESRDRTAAWRKVNRRVRASSWHALRLRNLADTSTLSLQLGSVGGVAVLTMTSAVAAAVGALILGFVMHIITTASGNKPAIPRLSKVSASMTQIFALCVCMYGGIAAMWVLFWRMPERHAARVHGKVFLLCMTWASMSVGMQVLNKMLVSKLQAPALISVGQMWIAVVLVGIPSYKELLDAPKWQLMTWLIVPLFFAAMLCTSCYTYEYMSLSFYTVIRNMTPLVVLPVERTLMPADKCPKLSYMVVISMVVMLAGTLMYGEGIGHVSIIGCIFAFTNMILAVSDRLIQRRLLTTECTGLASSVCTVMNNAFGSIPALLLAGATHQISDMTSPEHRASWTDPRVLTLLALSGAIGIGICYLGFECQRVITATSFFVLQNFSKVVVIVCGVMFFGDPIRSPLAVAGLVLSVGGSFCYGKAQMSLQEQAAKEQRLRKGRLSFEPPAAQKAV